MQTLVLILNAWSALNARKKRVLNERENYQETFSRIRRT